MIRSEWLLIRGNMAPTMFVRTLETQLFDRIERAHRQMRWTVFLKHRYVAKENKAEYVDIADFAEVEHTSSLANLPFLASDSIKCLTSQPN